MAPKRDQDNGPLGTYEGCAGVVARWTTWGFGLAHAIWPEFYDRVGLWLMRAGTAVTFVGSAMVIAVKYIA